MWKTLFNVAGRACLGLALVAGQQGVQAAGEQPPPAVWLLADAVRQSGDARDSRGVQSSFAVVDKAGARLWVFSARGELLAQTPVLLGQARGDVAPPDIGTRPLSRVRAHEKITPAGRFVTEPGVNHKGEDIVWLDYDSALSMHRLRDVPGEQRPRRMASGSLADKRISYGCINVPPNFFDQHVMPLFGDGHGVVYILPEERDVAEVFPFAQQAPARR
ncbi:MAG: L,D-transpeptidase [Pseudomonadota bacterium]|nr:L,D-transpeptidase [Pseudomonadota bacterium]